MRLNLFYVLQGTIFKLVKSDLWSFLWNGLAAFPPLNHPF